MAKYTKYIFLVAAIILTVASLTVFKRDKNKTSFKLQQNEVVIDNFEMGKVLDEQNNFYKVTAKTAEINKDTESALLTDFAAHYKKDKTRVDLYAHKGFMEKEFIVTVKGKIKGRINEIDFQTSPKGFFHYDFLTGIATILGKMTMMHNNGEVTADKIVVYSKNNYAEFIGHVHVTYKK